MTQQPETIVLKVEGNIAIWQGYPVSGQRVRVDLSTYGGIVNAYVSGERVVIQTRTGGTAIYNRYGTLQERLNR